MACTGCGLIRTDPMPTPAEVTDYYNNIYRWDYQLVSSKPSRRHMNRSRALAAFRLEYLAPALHAGARILDFGCGAGQFLGMASEKYSVLGIEPGRDYAKYARETFGVEVICEMWEDVNLPKESFDVITTVEVIEHLRRPVEALRWLASLLKAGGVIYVTVPNALPTKDRETFRMFHFAHLHNFTPTTLLWAGAVCGLEPDPRFVPNGTMIAFRKAGAAVDPSTFRKNHGVGLSTQYPKCSVLRYLFTGRWLIGRYRQIVKTLRDTFRM